MELSNVGMEVDTEQKDKIDMSLDEIIMLNKKLQMNELFNGKARTGAFQQFRGKSDSRQLGSHIDAFNMRGRQMKKPPYGAKAFPPMRRMPPWYGVSPFKHSPLNMRNQPGQRQPFGRRVNFSRSRNFLKKPLSSIQRNYVNGNYSQSHHFRRDLKMQQQKDIRQATYFHRRGLKVQTAMDEEQLVLNNTDPCRTSMNSSGTLTVSINNPTAVTLPSMGTRLPRPQLPFLLKKEGSETKVPKGVPLDFDINSVAKQTGITLNERFKILKEQRLSQTVSKGSRFVTVG
ncbi:UAP56-interacting factor isoform X2 [Mixophyes fleayi]|uniref:UAP56-interacting factor isoform X2 n=1 Tax=Mixophyes fleayi TaxID=3061075 RepID=UPI003F4E3EF8